MTSAPPDLVGDPKAPAPREPRWGTTDRLFPWVAAALLLVAITPVWSSRFLPLLDDPNHLSAIYIWKQLASASSPLHEFYDVRLAPVSYLLHYGIAYLLSFVVGVEIAHKLVLSLYVLSFPVAGYFWCRATDRTPWLSLTTIPLAYSITWSYGFHSFNAGLAVCLFGVVAQDALLRHPSWRRALVVAGLGLACYFGHPLPLVLFWACSAVLWAVHAARVLGKAPRFDRSQLVGWLYSFAGLLPSFAMYQWESSKASVGAQGMRSMLGPDFPLLGSAVLRDRLADFADNAVNPLAGPDDSRVFSFVLLGAALLFAVGAVRGRAYRSLALAAGVFALYLVLPDHFSEPVYLWIARGRLASLAAFFLLLSPAISDQMRARWLALVVALVGAIVPIRTALAYHAFDRQMGSFERVLEACPPGEQILTIRIDGSDTPTPGFDQPVFRQLPSWVQVVHGGYNPSEFPRPIPFPFFMKKSLPSPHWRGHDQYAPLLQPAVFGCVLTMNLPQRLPENLYKLAREDGNFALYRRL